MSLIPDIVRLRIEQLALDPEAIQAPNFAASDLTFHEPRSLPGEPMRGTWALDGHEFAFSLVGQLSANNTFLGEHGDLAVLARDGQEPTFGALRKAKWKMTVVLPKAFHDSALGMVLKRQFDIINLIQDANLARSPLKPGTQLGCSFVHCTKYGMRASALSENIFRSAVDASDDVVEAGTWPDSNGVFAKLVDDRKAALVVKPIELFAPNDTIVPAADVLKVFTPGSWVQVVCSLKMWDTSEATPSRARQDKRGPVRSFQLCFDTAQKLCDGRLDEGVLHTKPAARKLKRPFAAVAGPSESDPARPTKVRRIAEAPSGDVQMASG